jgi:pimeloyl-ACP methyl ester carboxylesterase
VLHDHGIQRAHLIGICGGAPIALAAAAELGPRVASVVVCHADLNFGAQVPRTPFQQQFQGFLCDAATSLERAKAVLDMFLDPNMLFGMPAPLAPFIVYPYCDLELFYRYAKINHGLMAYNASEVARRLDQRVLIVTSRTDRMTHPASSYYLHRIVNDSELSERETGSHHDVLLPDQELFTTILEFVGADVGATSLAARQ